jgi:hypothetical protein
VVEGDLFLEHPTGRLDHLPNDLVLHQRRIDDEAGIQRSVHAGGDDVAGPLINFNLGHCRPIGHMMRAEPDATAARDAALRPRRTCDAWCPSGGFGGGVEHAEPAVIADVLAAEF